MMFPKEARQLTKAKRAFNGALGADKFREPSQITLSTPPWEEEEDERPAVSRDETMPRGD